MQYDQTVITPKGLAVHIRNGVASDGSAVLENFDLTHAETDYLLSYPDENHFDAEQESRYLEKKATSPNERSPLWTVKWQELPESMQSERSIKWRIVPNLASVS